MDTQLCTEAAYLPLILNWLLPPVAAVLSAIALWVASLSRSTSRDALWISRDQERLLGKLSKRPTRNVSQKGVRDRRKHLTKGITSTSPGSSET